MGVPDVDDMAVVELPEPDILGIVLGHEEPVLGAGQGPAGDLERDPGVGHVPGHPSRAWPAGVGRVRPDEADGGLARRPEGDVEGDLLAAACAVPEVGPLLEAVGP